MRNYWVAQPLRPFASWHLTLKPLFGSRALEQALLFAESFEALGRAYEIFEILETKEPNRFIKTDENSYLQYMEQTVKETGKLPFFALDINITPRPSGSKTLCPGKICYFSDDNVVEAVVENVGSLLASWIEKDEPYIPEIDELLMPSYTASIAPISLFGTHPTIATDYPKWSSTPQISIELYTDIWFPWVRGYAHIKKSQTKADLYDNRQLANCHTNRLNQFLTDAKKLTLEFDGTWECIKETSEIFEPMYVDMIHETGIDLNWDYQTDKKNENST